MADGQDTRAEFSKEERVETPLPRFHGKRCFVVMPFGLKPGLDGKDIDFDAVYKDLIAPPLTRLLGADGFQRSDDASSTGLIHKEMIDEIISADLVVVDITTGNPNVFYELGVRHAAKRTGTVIIKRSDQNVPYNIGGVRAFEYPADGEKGACERFRNTLSAVAQNALDGVQIDSLVHGLLRGLNVTRRARPIRKRETIIHRLPTDCGEGRELGIVTGDIAHALDIDIWLNPKNTAMQMGRFYDDTISATIRYFGARRDSRGYVINDLISDELKKAMGRERVVQPGAVLITGAGQLRKTNGVKRVFHLAAQYGEPSKGYLTVRNAAGCVNNCLRMADELNRKRARRIGRHAAFTSLLVPLFGVRSPDRQSEEVARDLVESVLRFFEKVEASTLRSVFFLAYSDEDLRLCEQAMKAFDLEPSEPLLRPRSMKSTA